MFQTSSNNQTNKSFSDNNFKEKLFAVLTYLTGGIFGFLLLLINRSQTHFLRYHIYQSIVLGLVFMLLNATIGILLDLGVGILAFNKSFQQIALQISFWVIKVVQIIGVGVIIYCVLTLCRNQYTWIKWISAQIYKML